MNKKVLFIGIIVILFVVLVAVGTKNQKKQTAEENTLSGAYAPVIDPADFTADITNPYFSFIPKTKFVYEADTEDGKEKTEVYVMDETRMVMGVKTRVVWDRVWLDGSLIENTHDWYAQDSDGNVWYFGEETAEYEDGKVTSTEGSWEAGVDGALPGIVMQVDPVLGETYREEYYAGQAEDMADIISLSEDVAVPFGSYAGCLETRNYTPLEPDVEEFKYYCKETGNVALEVEAGGTERVELVSIEKNAEPSS